MENIAVLNDQPEINKVRLDFDVSIKLTDDYIQIPSTLFGPPFKRLNLAAEIMLRNAASKYPEFHQPTNAVGTFTRTLNYATKEKVVVTDALTLSEHLFGVKGFKKRAIARLHSTDVPHILLVNVIDEQIAMVLKAIRDMEWPLKSVRFTGERHGSADLDETIFAYEESIAVNE